VRNAPLLGVPNFPTEAIPQNYSPLAVEEEVREFWRKHAVQKKVKALRAGSKVGTMGYVEGPPTLNGFQHVGHARGRAIKDLWYRWRTMQGYCVPFRAGWDCQGLPVELEVEKELGVLKGKKQLLEEVGEERFVEECKRSIMRYYEHWRQLDDRFGMFLDYDEAYWTYRDEYIEREWEILKRAWEQGLLGEGYRVVAYCPYCQTSLSNAEVGLGYEQVSDPSIYFKFPLRGRKGEYLIIWTTMPFTLVTDELVAVKGDAQYDRVRVGDEVWIIARARTEPVLQGLGVKSYRVESTCAGEELERLKYDYPFLGLIPKQRELDSHPKIHTIIAEDFVDTTTATGLVHLSPGNGEDDFQAAQSRGLEIYSPFGDDCNFTDEAGAFAGKFARDADDVVISELKARGLLLSSAALTHEYPLCWRSHHKLVWVARREYFLWTDRVNEKVLEAADKVEYFFEPGRNRFLAYLKERKPWCISRQRVWGAPLPIWACSKCGAKRFVGSKRELLSEGKMKGDKAHFELHKPWIDWIEFTCKCGEAMRREPFVLDAWHNSGAAPYAAFTDEEVRKFVPVAFLVEGIDQTRGWASSLLLENVMRTGAPESPYRAFLFYGLVLDEKGNKMSKSLGNVVETAKVLEKFPADLYRLYLLWKAAPIDPISFSHAEMRERPFQILSTIYNLARFLYENASYDGFDPMGHSLDWAKGKKQLGFVDLWILAELQQAVSGVTEGFEKCEFNKAMATVEHFVIDSLSRQYVPMIRRRLWSDDPETAPNRMATYAVLWTVLLNVIALLNPVSPHLCEYLYQRAFRKVQPSLPESVNLLDWPRPVEALYGERLREKFELLTRAIALANSARQRAKMKRRLPLSLAIVQAPKESIKVLKELEELFLDAANVKEVEYAEKPPSDLTKLSKAEEGDLTVYVRTERDEALIAEGLMRDIARRIQALRKGMGLSPTQYLERVLLRGPDEVKAIEPLLPRLSALVRAKQVAVVEEQGPAMDWKEFDLEGKALYVAIETEKG